MGEKKTPWIKDLILYGVFVIGIIAIGISCFKSLNIDKVSENIASFFGQIILFILGMITVFDVCDTNGFNILVPNSYSSRKRNKQEGMMKNTIFQYQKMEKTLLLSYKKERINHFMNQLGLSEEQFEDVKFEILRLQLMPAKNIKEMQQKLKEIILHKYVLINQKDYKPGELVYDKVNYYINLTDIMYGPLAVDIVHLMGNFIKDSLNIEINKVSKIVVPENGNYLLGLKLHERLKKGFVKMLPKERIIRTHFWEGNFEENEKVIIVHDVLVTAEQIIKSIEKFPKPCSIIGIFCLVNRTDHAGKKKLEELELKVYSILELSDNEIEKLLMDAKKDGGD